LNFEGVSIVEQVCIELAQVVHRPPVCVETGTMYAIEESNLIHTTTNNIFNFLCRPCGGKLFSLDIDKEHQEAARTLCYGPDCIYLEGDSVESLDKLKLHFSEEQICVDVLWLDSKEFDEAHAVKEFCAIKDCLRPDKHFIMVDDIHNSNSVKYKWVVPILKSIGYSYVEIPTPTGLFVSWCGY